MHRALLYSLISVGLGFSSGWGQNPPDSSLAKRKADRELSRSFQPPRYRIGDARTADRLRSYFQDGANVQGKTLYLNRRGMQRLEGDVGVAPDSPGLSSAQRTRKNRERRLAEIAGAGLEEEPVYGVAEYFPDDLALQTTPQWPHRNDGSLAGSKPGLDLGTSKVWEKLDGDDSIVVAVLDAGINFYHPDLKDRWFVNKAESNGIPGVDDDGNGFIDDSTGWDFVDGDNRPHDSHGHGTYISGVIAAKFDNARGIAGMLPRARILPVRVLGTVGDGSSSDIAAGMRYAAKMGADVINFSIGIGSASNDTVLRNSFIIARDSGVIVAAAAANDARNLDAQPRAPSNYGFSNVYMVAAHTQTGALAGYSNYGATTVDLAAPGDFIVSTSIPAPIVLTRKTFENSEINWKGTPGAWVIGPDTLEGTKSLKWVSGDTAAVVFDSLDLRGRTGGQLNFILEFQRARTSDQFWVDVQTYGTNGVSSGWTEVATITANVTGKTVLSYDLGSVGTLKVDGKLFRIRFKAAFSGTGTRAIRIDDVKVRYADENPANQDVYFLTGGTSLAAPYFAGYAALMRVASARAGVPLTRARMLAGTVPDSNLTGKVITGGRLDVAKGLDFYLRTVPALSVSPVDTVLPVGNPVNYTLSVRDSLSQSVAGYTYTQGPGTAGGGLSGNQYSWNPGSQTGSFTVRFKAEKSPLVLRKQVRFLITAGPIALAGSGISAAVIRVAGRNFALPAFALQGGSHTLRLEILGADGRIREAVTGVLNLPAGAARTEYRVTGLARGVGVRAWLNGIPLQSAP